MAISQDLAFHLFFFSYVSRCLNVMYGCRLGAACGYHRLSATYDYCLSAA